MDKRNINIRKSLAIDSLCIFGIIRGTSMSFFLKHNFLILPYVYRDAILLPQLDYSFLKQIIHNNSKYEKEYFLKPVNKAEKQILPILEHKLKRLPKIKPSQEENEIKNYCLKNWNKINSTLSNVFPLWSKVKQIDVYLVNYGTVAAFDYLSHKDGDKIIIWLRTTQPTLEIIKAHFIHALVSAIVLENTKILDKSDLWTAREFAIDFLLAHTSLAQLAPPKLTIRELKRHNLPKKVIEDSQKFKAQLIKYQKPLTIKLNPQQHSLSINKKTIELSDLEWRLIKALYSRKSSFIPTTELAELVYPDKEVFFGWSLAKTIERLRKKIAYNGINQRLILSSRGKGYMLNVYN